MESLEPSGVPLAARGGDVKVESGGERVCKKAKSCAPTSSQQPDAPNAAPTTKTPAVTARKSQPAKLEPPQQLQQPPSRSPTVHHSPKPSMPPPPPLVLKAESQLRRMPPRPSSAVVTPIAGPPVKSMKVESGTRDDGIVTPSSKTEIAPSVAPTTRAVITPSRAKPAKHAKVDKVQPDEVSEASTVPGELEPAPTQMDQDTQRTTGARTFPDTQVDSPAKTVTPPPVEPAVPKTVQPTPPAEPMTTDVAALPKQTPQPQQAPPSMPPPKPKQAAAAVQPPVRQQQTDLDQQFQVQNNDVTPIEHSSQKERQQHYAAFKRQVTGEITSITVPQDFCDAWKNAVASNSRSAKNKLFQLWCSAGGSWSKIFGLT